MRLMTTSISAKITLFSSSILAACLISGGYLLMWFENDLMQSFIKSNEAAIERSIDERAADERNGLLRSLNYRARTLARTSSGYIRPFNPERLREILTAFMSAPEFMAIEITAPDGAPMLATWKRAGLETGERLPAGFPSRAEYRIEREIVIAGVSGEAGDTVARAVIHYTDSYLNVRMEGYKERAMAIAHATHSDLLKRFMTAVVYQSLAIIAILAVLIFSLYVLLRTMIFEPMADITGITRRLADYDLCIDISDPPDDEVGKLLETVGHMVDRLKEIIASASEVAVQVNDAAEEIAGAVGSQASVVRQQSGLISDISENMEALSNSSKEIADHADSVAELAHDAYRRSFDGAESVGMLMQKMETIDADNQKNIHEILSLGRKAGEIAQVSDIINTIADQTRLIAFNAALEASSAGEAGKRFGVVAAEVRRLADSVTASTVEIESRMNEISEAADQMVLSSEKGTREIRETLEQFSQTQVLLENVVSTSEETTESVHRISASTQQQKTATNQIATTLKDIVHGAEQTSDAISRISRISDRLAEVSQSLQQLMERFKLNDTATKN